MARGHLLRSLTPLYLARVASFVIETRMLVAAEVEEKIESLCRTFEENKPYLAARWGAERVSSLPRAPDERQRPEEARLEV
jgi:hypothetical protein